jgi:hypothetical protein
MTEQLLRQCVNTHMWKRSAVLCDPTHIQPATVLVSFTKDLGVVLHVSIPPTLGESATNIQMRIYCNYCGRGARLLELKCVYCHKSTVVWQRLLIVFAIATAAGVFLLKTL